MQPCRHIAKPCVALNGHLWTVLRLLPISRPEMAWQIRLWPPCLVEPAESPPRRPQVVGERSVGFKPVGLDPGDTTMIVVEPPAFKDN